MTRLLLTALLLLLLATPAWAAFPIVVAVNGGVNDSNTEAQTINLPNGSNVTGRLVIAAVSIDNPANSYDWPAGWTQCLTPHSSDRLHVRYRKIDGTEGFSGTGDTITLVRSGQTSQQSAHRTLLISDWHGTTPPECATVTTGNDASPDPGTVTASWGSADNLFIAVVGLDNATGGAANSITGFPATYGNNQNASNGANATGASAAVATRNLAAASDNPGTFTANATPATAADGWNATTIVVRPAAGVCLPCLQHYYRQMRRQ